MAKVFNCNWNGTNLINSTPPSGENAYSSVSGEAAGVFEKMSDGLGWNGDINYAKVSDRKSVV